MVLDEFKDRFTLFLESGFIAVNQADEDSAVKLFNAAEMVYPDHVLTRVGFGYMYLCKLEIKKAIEMFEGALKREPNNEIAKSLLGFCFSLTPDQGMKGEKILEETKNETKDKGIKELNNVLLDFVDQFVKAKPSPETLPASSIAKKQAEMKSKKPKK